MRVTTAAGAQWQEVSLPGKIVGDIRLYHHDVPREETDLTGTTVEMLDGAQALWHSHPRGQIFFAISGLGQIQVEGGDVIELQPGDSIWAPPGERHCHGAAPDHDFTFTSVEPVDPATGSVVEW
jgi:quercetin dioxygenase-like cupin family protein